MDWVLLIVRFPSGRQDSCIFSTTETVLCSNIGRGYLQVAPHHKDQSNKDLPRGKLSSRAEGPEVLLDRTPRERWVRSRPLPFGLRTCRPEETPPGPVLCQEDGCKEVGPSRGTGV